MHFATERQISYVGGLISYALSLGTKACVKAADLIDSDETCIASRGLWAVAILKSLLCLSAGALQESRGCSIYQDTAFRSFFIQLTTCTYLTAQWLGHCWRGHRLNLLTDSRHTSLETQTQIWNWLRQQPPRTSVVHYLQTVHCWLPLRQRWQNSCILSSRLMTTPYAEDMLPTRFQENAQSEQHWHSHADIKGFICRKLKDINECTPCSNMPKDGRERYVLFLKITNDIKK